MSQYRIPPIVTTDSRSIASEQTMTHRIARLSTVCLLTLLIPRAALPFFQENPRAAETGVQTPQDEKLTLLARDAPEFESIAGMFQRFMTDWQAQDADRLADHFYFDRMLQELRSQRLFEELGLGDAAVAAFIEGVKPTMGRSLVNSPMLRLKRHEIRSIQLAASGREARIIVRHSSSDGIRGYVRWWLVNVDDRWRIYDMEDLETGFRVSTGAVLTGAQLIRSQKFDELRRAIRELTQLVPMMLDRKYEEVEVGLERLSDRELPLPFEPMRWMMAAASKIGLVEPTEALACIEKASDLRADMPVLHLLRAAAYNMLEKPEQAVVHAQRYLEIMGEDAEAFMHLGDALAALDRSEAAADAYRKGLADNADSIENLIGLVRVLPKDAKQELSEHVARLSKPQEQFDFIASEFTDDADTLEVLVESLRKRSPDDPSVALYGGMVKVSREQFDEAATLLRSAFDRARDDDQRESLHEWFLFAMMRAKKPLEGYTAVPDARHAFRYVAEWLVADDAAAALRTLIEAHGKSHSDDPWLHYFTAAAFVIEGKYAEADKAYAAGMALPLDDEASEEFRSGRVFARFQAGRGLSAYEEFGPRKQTFDQLAELMFDAKHADHLEKLVAAHRAHSPDDSNLRRWDVEVLWLRKDYAAAVELLRTNEKAFVDGEADEWWYVDRLVRVLVRLGKSQAAVSEVRSRDINNFDTLLLVLAYAAAGDVEQTIRAFEQCLEEGYDLDELYGDEDLGPILRSDAFRTLRTKYPPN